VVLLTLEQIVPGPAVELVVAGPALEGVVSLAAVDDVLAATAFDLVVPLLAVQLVGPAAAPDHVATRAPVHLHLEVAVGVEDDDLVVAEAAVDANEAVDATGIVNTRPGEEGVGLCVIPIAHDTVPVDIDRDGTIM